ncbi:MAG: hypothetical protein F6K28_28155 [Microcoleus sp. SIO2G3]|nr:hypothetical protein [Microcoleus sp. SIO2G3]
MQNAAGIFAVAQVAVNQLQAEADQSEPIAALPAAPMRIDRAELKSRYGSFNACRQAAKQQGIRFGRNPSWEQLEAAFGYAEACQQVVRNYIAAYPCELLQGVSIELKL